MKYNSTTPTSLALLPQIASLVIVVILMAILPPLRLLEWALIQGALAALISYAVKMPVWWIPIQLCFMPAIAATLSIGLSPLWFACGFGILALIYGKTYQTQVPLYLSSKAVTRALGTCLPQQGSFNFIDLGCGCGGLLHALEKTHPDGNFQGVEAAPLPYFIGKIRNVLMQRSNCEILWGDLWKQDLGQYDIVYAYLSPVPMQALWEKVQREMRPGSMFISNTFIVPDVAPDDCIALDDFSGSTLYIWRIQHNQADTTHCIPQNSDRSDQSVPPPGGALRPVLKNNA